MSTSDGPGGGLTIREVAELTGLAPHTLRYYERIGLVRRVDRSTGNQRRYEERDLAWVLFLVRLRGSGMPVTDMARFAELRRAGDRTLDERLRLLRTHRCRIDQRVAELRDNAAVVDSKIAHYQELISGTAAPAPSPRAGRPA